MSRERHGARYLDHDGNVPVSREGWRFESRLYRSRLDLGYAKAARPWISMDYARGPLRSMNQDLNPKRRWWFSERAPFLPFLPYYAIGIHHRVVSGASCPNVEEGQLKWADVTPLILGISWYCLLACLLARLLAGRQTDMVDTY